jgi:hypothetical protein
MPAKQQTAALKRLNGCQHEIKTLSSCNKKQRDLILSKASPALIRTFQEITLNILEPNGAITVKPNSPNFKKLKRHRLKLHSFVSMRRTPINKARQQMKTQVGGFLGILAKLAIPLIGSLLGGLFKEQQ